MPVLKTIKLLWENIKNIPDRLKKLIELSAADGAIFLDTDGNYRIVPFGNSSNEIAEGNHNHVDYQPIAIKNQPNGYLGLNSIGVVDFVNITALNSFYEGNTHPVNKIKFGASPTQYITFHGSGTANFLTSVSTAGGPRPLFLRVVQGSTTADTMFSLTEVNFNAKVIKSTNTSITTNPTTGSLLLDGIGMGGGNIYTTGEIHAGNGATGTFVTSDEKTVTVTDGIITAIN